MDSIASGGMQINAAQYNTRPQPLSGTQDGAPDAGDTCDTVERGSGGSFKSLSGIFSRVFGRSSAAPVQTDPSTPSAEKIVSSAAAAIPASSVAAAMPGPAGAGIASQVQAQVQASGTWNDAAQCMAKGFQDIVDSPGAPQYQKDMAAFGKAILPMVKDSAIAGFLGNIVLTSIASGAQKVDIAKLALAMNAHLTDADTWEDGINYYRGGFKAIKAYPLASADDRANAAFGLKVLEYSGSACVRTRVCHSLADAIMQGKPLMDVPGLAGKMESSASAANTWADARKLLETELRAISEYPGSKADERKLAGFGVSLLEKETDDGCACGLAGLVVDSLKHAAPEVPAAKIAQQAGKMSSSASTWADSRKIWQDAASMIVDNPDASPEDMQYGTWCSTVLDLKGSDMIRSKYAGFIMNSLERGDREVDLKRLSSFAAECVRSASTWKEGIEAVALAFKVVGTSPCVTDDIKILGLKGYKDVKAGPETKEGCDKGLKALKDLADVKARQVAARKEMEKMAESLVPGQKDTPVTTTVALDDQSVFIEVDGIKIKRRNDPVFNSHPDSK